MKKIYLFLSFLVAFSLLAKNVNAQCLAAANGQWPSATFTPGCTGSSETIVIDGYGAEYSLVNVTNGIAYTFTSSVATDYITISNSGGTTAYAFGTTPVTWTATISGVIRFYTHTNSACGAASVNRTRAMQCTIPTCSGTPIGGTATATPAVLCSSTTSTINLSGQSSGVALQWQSSPAGAGTWTNVSTGTGGTTASYTTATITATTDFRCKVTCNNGGAISYSTTATVSLSSVPVNDLVCNATTLVLNGPTDCGNTTCATATGDPTFANSTANNTVWYKYTPTTTGVVTFNMTRPVGATSGLLYGWVGIYTATGTCPALVLTEVTSNLSYDLTTNTTVSFASPSLTAGTTYYFMIDGFSGAFGAYCIGIITPPTPPLCTTNSSPANNAINVSAPVATLNWNAATGATAYDIYFGTTNTPPLLGTTTTSATTIDISGLTVSTSYYWYTVPRNAGGAPTTCSTATSVFKFTTQSYLPVSITSFRGERKNTSNWLTWETATEANNAGFELQRSVDGTNFSALGFVASKASNGTSNGNLSYEFTDAKSLVAGCYYRLKQMDKDGKSTISSIVFIKGAKINKLDLTAVYPNPATDKLNVLVASPKADNVTFVVSDIVGKVILSQTISLTNGDNNIRLNVSSLTKGTYSLKVVCADGCETAMSKFIKQ